MATIHPHENDSSISQVRQSIGSRVTCASDRRSEVSRSSLGPDPPPHLKRKAMETPPPFQESAHCDICRCTFSTFRRRHHCRSCGRTLCHEHSSYHMALPQYGIYTDVRVCYNCFNKKSSSQGGAGNAGSAGRISGAADSFSGLSLGKEDASSPMKNSTVQSAAPIIECKCGMPLCICEAPKPEPAPVKQNISTIPSSTTQSNPKPKKPASSQPKASATSSSNSSSFLNIGLMSNDSNGKGLSDYEVSGEGLREAIKSGDVKGVKKLLSQAALFNQTEIALILMDHGANVQSKNGQGETPLDCAPAMLQYKMRQRMEELAASQRPPE
ncbi:vacuolar protein sorting-associated protein 27 isoform X1 [Panicum miliaceum]|uniref:Vacuolar protein sorting-associated protein 27 isoform X1 n=1 Tax=Panicum miliaceum TaxID=4540 RepID=A0A3L6QPW1_PANMI|nr:vacuolar protein sorting-associated protein 27 isoform X1 [Panicum miliaceum]